MANQEAYSIANNEKLENTSGAKKLVTDQVGVPMPHRLIDNYILEVWQESPPSPALEPANGDLKHDHLTNPTNAHDGIKRLSS